MGRLRSGILDAAAAEGSGVESQREASHRLIPPKGDQDKYRAEVTIRTTVSLAHAPPAANLPPRKAEPDLMAEEGESDEFILEEEETVEEPPVDNGVTRRAIEKSRTTTSKVYELVYDNERWKLVDEISSEDDEVAKVLFDFALQQ